MSREDPALEAPELPPLDEPLGSLEAEPGAWAGPSDPRTFVLAGRRAWLTGDTGSGVASIVLPPVRAVSGFRVAGAESVGAELTALGVERRLRVGGAGVLERVVVPRGVAAALLEWSAPDRGVSLTVGWTVHALAGRDPSSLRWRRIPRGLVVAPGDGGLVAFVFSRPPHELEVTPAPSDPAGGLRVRVGVRLEPGPGVRLAVARGGASDLGRALAAVARPRALVMTRLAAAERLRTERLSLSTPEPELERELEWVKLRLADRWVETPGVGRAPASLAPAGGLAYDAADAVTAALDGLTVGDFDGARDAMDFLLRHQDGAGGVPARWQADGRPEPGDTTPAALLLLLAARFLGHTGDIGCLQERYAGLRRAGARIGDEAGGRDRASGGRADGGLKATALDALASVAEAVGDVASGGRAPPPAPTHLGQDRPLHDPDGTLSRVRRLLGVEPDAARGRLVLRPRPPLEWSGFQARSIRVGDASLSLTYRRDGPVHRLVVAQDGGAAPLRLVLEPELTGRIVAARVDGQPADLTTMGAGLNRTRAQVQLALDHGRTLELETDTETGTPGG